MEIEIKKVLLARAIRRISVKGSAGYLPEVVELIKSNYHFIIAPKIEDLIPSEPPKGAEFRHGKLLNPAGQTVVMEKFTVFNDGLVVETTTSTNDADLFLDDLARWAANEIPNVQLMGRTYYVSHLLVKMPPLETYAPTFCPVGEKIAAVLKGYGLDTARYEPSSLTLYFDTVGKPAPQPGAFVLERRVGLPYKEEIWFSQAPLKTSDHIKLLQDLPRTM